MKCVAIDWSARVHIESFSMRYLFGCAFCRFISIRINRVFSIQFSTE